jgi:metal-responsive CopG/Arc/MetJ family transcriptional regulator
MSLLKRTYALPSETLTEFEQVVASGKRSAVIAGLLRDWLEEQQRQKLRRQVVEGCREMAGIYLEIEQAYHPLEEEVHHAFDARPEAG